MLDNVLTYFIDNAPEELSKARYSAIQERSIGLGAMGFHSALQRRGINFESGEAVAFNNEAFAYIKEKAVEESKRLSHERGEAPDMQGSGLRNAHLLAVAPNANSSIIADTSPSIEPWHANAFVHRTRAGSYLVKNKYLQKALGKNDTDETWSSIISNQGSVSHLTCLDDNTKAIFKTAIEIDQQWVIKHASARQQYICQGQSVNLFFPANANRAAINRIHVNAWKYGLKGLYYLRTEAGTQTEKVGEKVERIALTDATVCAIDNPECEACKV
jgi:ribonucleoside-diphosphate reductase alpha chain